MPNMTYCRYRNTLMDLRDCYDDIHCPELDDEEMSEEELEARAKLIALCKEIGDELDDQ